MDGLMDGAVLLAVLSVELDLTLNLSCCLVSWGLL